jgi:23S rRNA (cytosine1962-C5)-methyltransferase
MTPTLADRPTTLITRPWDDFGLLDCGDGRKLERYGPITVVRPEPQCFWTPHQPAAFDRADAVFDPQDEDDAGRWRFAGAPIDPFTMAWRDVCFTARLTAFRHLAVFPEQAANWEWLDQRVRQPGSGSPTKVARPRILNLFGYTGVASLVCAAAGAEVTHVDASKKSVAWARENAELSGLSGAPVRWIVDDARKYVAREVRRGARYDGIILDPPKYGRGPTGEVWRLFEDLPGLMDDCAKLLGPEADFLLLNAYAARISGLSLAHLTADALAGRGGTIDWGELALGEADPAGRAIGLSFFARWTA